MYEARIEFQIGAMSFMGEGDKDWVSDQLDKILKKASELSKIPVTATNNDNQNAFKQDNQIDSRKELITSKTLPSYLQEMDAKSNQVKKFLVTAIWLTAKGQNRLLTTKDVTQTLRESNQKRLGNASDCLNKNVGKGHCEKDGSEFFVTQEGRDSIEI